MKHQVILFAQQILDPTTSGLPKVTAGTGRFQTITNIVLGIVGAISLLIITLAGFKYITSQGNPNETARAREAIIYAGIGLAVCILAGAIVNFVIGRVT